MKTKYLLLLILMLGFYSCGDDAIESGPPEIEVIDPELSFVGDTITLYGIYFGQVSSDNFISINDTLIINSEDCLKWTDRIIRFELNYDFEIGDLIVNVGNLKSNSVTLRSEILPPLATVKIPSGIFEMGSDIGLADEKPVHLVNISNSFEMSIYEITRRQYKSIMSVVPGENNDPEVPVDSVVWGKALEFCNKLSQKQGYKEIYIFTETDTTIDPTANGWRLPTEAEWEYACRAGSTSDFGGTGNLNDMGWYDQNSGYQVHKSGLKQSNAFGLYDMHGNVWEWCWDYYDPNYYSNSPTTDPANNLVNERRVARGGSYSGGNSFARASNRNYDVNNITSTGFRIIRYIID